MAPDRVALFSAALPGWTASRIVAAASSLGLRAIEWGAGPGQAIERTSEGEALAKLGAESGLAVCGISVQDPEVTVARPRGAEPFVRLAGELGAPHVRILAPTYCGGRLSREQSRVRAGLARLVETAAPLGIRVLVEVSPMTIAPTPALLLTILAGQPPDRVGALYDPGNMAIEGHVAPRLAVEQLRPYLAHVHVKNIAWRRHGGVWRWHYATLADGMLDWPEILGALQAVGYRGRIALDHLRGRPSPQALRSEVAYLRTLLAEPR